MRPPIELTIRPYQEVDRDFVSQVSGEAFAGWAERPRGAVRRMLASPGSFGLVAEVDGRRAGFVVVRIVRTRPYGPLQNPTLAHVDAIAVRAELRRRGVGRRLLGRAVGLARGQGALSVWLMTAVSNGPARALFQKVGFAPAALQPGAYVGGERALIYVQVL